MILSVLNHTKTKVKFWMLENYVSPWFKEFMPHMAKEYGFEIGLVSYNWPERRSVLYRDRRRLYIGIADDFISASPTALYRHR